jgi:putative ABC transport system permease protein
MMLLEGIWLALRSIAANKLRTSLTVLANIVAVSSVIAVVSILDGMDTYVKEQVLGEGTGIITVQRLDQLKILSSLDEFIKSLRNPRITLDDVEYLREHLEFAEEIDAQLSRGSRVSYRKRYADIGVQGRYSVYPLFRDDPLAAGRHFSRLEVEAKSMVAVVGWDVADSLFPDEDPLGKTFKIGRRPFRIVGVVEERPNVLGQNRNRFAIIPITTFQKIYGSRASVNALVMVTDLEQIREGVDEATTWMRIRHRLRPGDRSDFEVTTAERFIQIWEGISSSIFLSLTGISAISLLIGGIIIMNIMLVSVTERTREIGIRKALGARRNNILWQILVESVTLSSAGGVLGITVGFLVASLVGALSPLPYTIAPWAIVAGIAVTVGTGLFFGIYPANQAARLDPIEALRHE